MRQVRIYKRLMGTNEKFELYISVTYIYRFKISSQFTTKIRVFDGYENIKLIMFNKKHFLNET